MGANCERTCRECRAGFQPRRSDQWYCSSICNKRAGNRELARARAVYRALYWWRTDRSSAATNLGFVCASIAAWIREDRAAQRLPPPKHNHMADRGALRRCKPL